MPRNSAESSRRGSDEEYGPEQETSRAVHFVNDARNGALDDPALDDFLYGRGRVGRIDFMRWSNFRDAMGQEQLHDVDISWVSQDLESFHNDARIELLQPRDEYHFSGEELTHVVGDLTHRMEESVTRHILDKSRHFPVKELNHPDPAVQDAWQTHVQQVIGQHQDQRRWEYPNPALRQLSWEAQRFNTNDTAPEGMEVTSDRSTDPYQ